MRALISLTVAFVIAAFVALASGGTPAYAAFHCVRIHAVLGSYNGDPNVQYVELRMDFPSQVFLGTHTLEFRDAAGTLKATFTFPGIAFVTVSVPNFLLGDSILIATSEFNTAATGGASDFVFTGANTVGANGGDPLHPVQGPGGKVGFAQGSDNCDADIIASPGEADSLAYGAATADFGTSAAPLPPAAGNAQGLRLSNLFTAPSNNHTEYSPQHVALSTSSVLPINLGTDLSTPRNNGRVILALPAIAPSPTPTYVAPAVGGVAAEPDQSLLPSRSSTRSAGHRTEYVLGAGAVAAAAALGAAAWATRRRRSTLD